jgi:hypothetical protein
MPRTVGTPETAVATATHDFPQRYTKNRKMVYPPHSPPFPASFNFSLQASNSPTSTNSAGLAMKPVLFVLAILALTKGLCKQKTISRYCPFKVGVSDMRDKMASSHDSIKTLRVSMIVFVLACVDSNPDWLRTNLSQWIPNPNCIATMAGLS